MFLEPFLFTDGGPANATLTMLLLIYKYAFRNSLGGDYGEATALSVMLAAVLAVLPALYFKLTRPLEQIVTTGRWPAAPETLGPAAAASDRRPPRALSGTRLAAARARRWTMRRLVHGTTLVLLVLIVGLGPILWLAQVASPRRRTRSASRSRSGRTGSTVAEPATAWNDVHIDQYFWQHDGHRVGSWFVQLFVATTAGYVLSVLRPAVRRRALTALVLATLFVPGVVLLVPLYLTIVDPPIVRFSLVNNYWAVWLPTGASAFNVVLVKRFFDNLPREVFEAARVDGAGPFRLFWSVVLPMSRPILGVVSVFAVIAAWKDYLWPMLVLPRARDAAAVGAPAGPRAHDRAGRLPRGARDLELIPIVMFLVFQRVFLSGAGSAGPSRVLRPRRRRATEALS